MCSKRLSSVDCPFRWIDSKVDLMDDVGRYMAHKLFVARDQI